MEESEAEVEEQQPFGTASAPLEGSAAQETRVSGESCEDRPTAFDVGSPERGLLSSETADSATSA